MQKTKSKLRTMYKKISVVTMENLSYASIYNYIYKKRVQEKKICSVLELFSLSKKNDRYKYWVTKHLEKIYKTQRFGSHISYSDYNAIKLINKRAHLSMRLKLRKVQHKAIEHVWRPNGHFANRLLKNL